MPRYLIALTSAAILCLAVTAGAQPNQARDRAMPRYRAGLDYLRAEAYAEAAKAFRDATEIDPSFAMAYYGLGRASMPQKKYGEAVAAYAKCRDLYRGQAGRLFTNQQEAQRYRQDQMTELDEAIRSYSSGPLTAQATEAIRSLNERKRQLQQTMQRGNNLSIDASVPAFVSLSLGSAFFRLEQFADAEREYKAAIAEDPKTGEAYNNLAVVYLQTGRVQEASDAVKAAEKAGYKVNPLLKDDIAARKKGAPDR
jgi:tetratricopeptide (TPR) repeat protein